MSANQLRPPSQSFPPGYKVLISRYADTILRYEFPERFNELTSVLEGYKINLEEIASSGGSRASHTKRFDDGLRLFGWSKRNITITKKLDDEVVHVTKGHEIDMFSPFRDSNGYPGIAVEMEWNNKDPFFDRDLLNFQALHADGAIAVGCIVTRGPRLQELLSATVKSGESAQGKYGASSTHWNKLIPRVELGGGGQCPLLLIGIEPERITRVDKLTSAFAARQFITHQDAHREDEVFDPDGQGVT